jgi:metal-responsive CopG/Arc/MetJ family transcriptional regulator
MKAVQIVLDDRLLATLDRAARRRKLSRSAFVRRSLEAALARERMESLLESERAAYARKPLSPDERATIEDLQTAQDRVLASLDGGDGW